MVVFGSANEDARNLEIGSLVKQFSLKLLSVRSYLPMAMH